MTKPNAGMGVIALMVAQKAQFELLIDKEVIKRAEAVSALEKWAAVYARSPGALPEPLGFLEILTDSLRKGSEHDALMALLQSPSSGTA